MRKKDLDKAYKSIYNCIYNKSGRVLTGKIRWGRFKNLRLKFTRRISFEEIIQSELFDIIDHPRRSNQLNLICECKGYVWVVPFVFEKNGIFLKTMYPSRKYKKLYEKGKI